MACDGRELAVAARKTESLTPSPGWVEFDAEALWQATAAAVRRAIDKAGISPDKIAAVACTGHGNGVYLVDAAGHPVRNAIFSADTRARAYVERWTAEGIDRAVRPKTMQSLWPGQPNALLAWLADHEPKRRQPNALVPDVQGLHAHAADRRGVCRADRHVGHEPAWTWEPANTTRNCSMRSASAPGARSCRRCGCLPTCAAA